MDDAPINLSRDVLAMCRAQGFALAGVCAARESDHAAEFRAWLDEGRNGEMAYLADNVEKRLDPRQLVPGARSVIMVADQYATRADPTPSPSGGGPGRGAPVQDDAHIVNARAPHSESNSPLLSPLPEGGGVGRIARYARGEDYHEAMKHRLQSVRNHLRNTYPEHRFRSFIDTAPVLEREHAARAGLGWIGKHTLLINPRLGSWLFLGGIITTMDLPAPPEQCPVPDSCGSCTRCIDACPTRAITPWSVNASRCISYLTIEHRSELPAERRAAMGDWVYGCDVCQEVCPHNSPRADGVDVGEARPEYAPRRSGFDLLEVLGWDAAGFRAMFRDSAIKRATLEMMQRNAENAVRNIANPLTFGTSSGAGANQSENQ